MDRYTAVNHADAGTDETVEHALELLDQALVILDGEDLLVAAAKVDDARNALRKSAGKT